MLVSLGGCDPQVKGHVAANLHVGNDRAKLIDVLTQLLPFIGIPARSTVCAPSTRSPWLNPPIHPPIEQHRAITQRHGVSPASTATSVATSPNNSSSAATGCRRRAKAGAGRRSARGVSGKTLTPSCSTSPTRRPSGPWWRAFSRSLDASTLSSATPATACSARRRNSPTSRSTTSIATNLVGSIQLIRAVLPHLRTQGGGRIIQLSTYGGQVAFPGNSMYHATKWGIEGFVELVAQEVAPFGIGVTIVEPGGARTEFRYGSAQVADPLSAYDDNPAHAFLKMLDPKNGLAAGDPARMAARIIESVDVEPAPLRIVLGSQALASTCDASQTDRRLRGADRALRFHGFPAWGVNGVHETHSKLRSWGPLRLKVTYAALAWEGRLVLRFPKLACPANYGDSSSPSRERSYKGVLPPSSCENRRKALDEAVIRPNSVVLHNFRRKIMQNQATTTSSMSVRAPWNKGRLIGSEASALPETRLNDTDQASGRTSNTRFGDVQYCDRQQVAWMRCRRPQS